MDWGVILILIIIVTILVMICNFYFTIFKSKDEFSKDELKEIKLAFSAPWSQIKENYSLTAFFVTFVVSAIIGLLLPAISLNWFVNSLIVYVIFFFALPPIAKNLKKEQVVETEQTSDNIATFFVKFHPILNYGLGCGMLASVIYNWSTQRVNTLWFFINLIGGLILLTWNFNQILHVEEKNDNI